MKIRNRQSHDVWCKCRKCGDTLTITLWMRMLKSGKYSARLEPTSDVKSLEGMLYHRPGFCDGVLQVFELPGPTILED